MYHNFIRSPLVTCADMVWLLYIINVYIIMPYKKTEIAWRIWIHQICFESSVFLIFYFFCVVIICVVCLSCCVFETLSVV
jgi:hypothetical protein